MIGSEGAPHWKRKASKLQLVASPQDNLSSVQPLQNSNRSSEIHWNFFDAQGTNLIRQKKKLRNSSNLVGGLNPSEKISQIGSFPQGKGENKRYLKPPPSQCFSEFSRPTKLIRSLVAHHYAHPAPQDWTKGANRGVPTVGNCWLEACPIISTQPEQSKDYNP